MDSDTKKPKPPMATKFDRSSSRLPKEDGFYWQRWRDGQLIECGDLLTDGTARHERLTVDECKPVAPALTPEDAEKIGRYLAVCANTAPTSAPVDNVDDVDNQSV